MKAQSFRWPRLAAASLALGLLGMYATPSLALSLGRITVKSALGEPLRAEIDIPNISAEEAATLQTKIAPPETFTAAGLEYNPAVAEIQATMGRRSDGRPYISLTGPSSVNEPYVDLIIEASWASGRVVRDYTMLFDPPSMRPAAPASALAQTATTGTTTGTKPAEKKPTSGVSVSKPAVAGDQQITVRSGDTASKIALRSKTAEVSLDQMLVAMLRANPNAFSKGNVNRLRAGAVLDLPSVEQAKALSRSEATEIVIAQSKDFRAFRNKLASSAPNVNVESADRKASGTLEPSLQDKTASAVASDKLTLSKGAVQSGGQEAKLAKELADKDAASRAAELAKNIEDLKKVGSATSASAAPANTVSAAQAGETPAIAITSSAMLPTASQAMSASASDPATAASEPSTAASQPQPAAPVASAPVTPALAPEQPGILDEILDGPVVAAAGWGGLALLGGLGLYLWRRRSRNNAAGNSSLIESRLQPDSFFGASGGQRVQTGNDDPTSVSSMVYSPSQLDAADDVDPVAEADVYLAYGRDVQAEEILKEALKRNPSRLAIHMKLLEIYAKRNDSTAFQGAATQARKLTIDESPEWARICELGLRMDPSNPLYQAQAGANGPLKAFSNQLADTQAAATRLKTQPVSATPSMAQTMDMDLDLDLDFSKTNVANTATATTASNAAAVQSTEIAQTAAASRTSNTVASTPASAPDSDMLEFDLNSLTLDLDSTNKIINQGAGADSPLETKLALAEEFLSIGDSDGARALVEEVIGQASGELLAKAQRTLAKLR